MSNRRDVANNLGHNHRRRPNNSRENWRTRTQPYNQTALTSDNTTNQRNVTNGGKSRDLHVGYKLLERWSNEEPDQLFIELSAKKSELACALELDLNNKVVLVIKVLARLREMPSEGRSTLTRSLFKEKFVDNLTNFLVQCAVAEGTREKNWNRIFWDNTEEFFYNLITVLELWLEINPTKTCMHSSKLLKTLAIVLPGLENEQNVRLSEDVKTRLQKFELKFKLFKEELERKQLDDNNRATSEAAEDRRQPPNDFRQLTVYPTQDELFHDGPVFIRKHITSGKYDNVDHYLDVQFRLLKEDFVSPLRKALKEYLQIDPSKKRPGKISNIRVYRKVTLLRPYYENNDIGVLVQFSDKRLKINFAKSKRFLYGSLLCFSYDNFATFVFGKVMQRQLKLLEKSLLVVGFEAEYDNKYVFDKPCAMIECSIYFEPYYHVLKALQDMGDDTFPLPRYLIDVESSVEPPDYLQDVDGYLKIEHFEVLPLGPNWPTAGQLGLNDSQHVAFKAALTSKFVVIQGPPGTGKTFLGLKIIKTLLANQNMWFNSTPILIVCFTNHALDQFLEGLLTTTQSIVRIGNRSKNEALERFSLKNVRMQRGQLRFAMAGEAIYRARMEVSQLSNSIQNIQQAITTIEDSDAVLDFCYFKQLNIHPFVGQTWFAKTSSNDLLKWLLGGRSDEARIREGIEVRANEVAARMVQAENAEKENVIDEAARFGENFFDDPNFDDMDEMFLDLTIRGTFQNCGNTLVSVTKLSTEIAALEAELADINNHAENSALVNRKGNIESSLEDLYSKRNYIKMHLNRPRDDRPRKPYLNMEEPHKIYSDHRWMLYFYCLNAYKTHLQMNLVRLEQEFKSAYRVYSELREAEDTRLIKSKLVVGMTTTSAARLQNTLQMLKCRIVLVEEAAEVLESHITVSLTKHCQHLILIGDHLQLRPSTADYRITTKFNLGISMFERMVLNNVQCHQLGVQHRMRPEIAKLICPSIYPKLENHDSVYHYPAVAGIDTSLYFIDHQHSEQETGDESKSNLHEVRFLLRLACYLLQNGYAPQDITILMPYLGQLFLFMDERKRYDLLMRDVRIAVLDNYQGEESKIILLSLVRNNNEKRVGFLNIQNRICVALSRAKEGLYVMGNMQMLSECNDLWPKIKATFETQNALGQTLPLRCQIHDVSTHVRDADDFDQVPEGGCDKICGFQLKCGHSCTMTCHIMDREHRMFQCKENCIKVLCNLGHVCPKMCYMDCGKCTVPMARVLEKCGHRHNIPCHVDLELYKCHTHVEAKLPCNHVVHDKPCFKSVDEHRCSHMCDTRVEPCGHACTRRCHHNNDPDHVEYKCYKNCERIKTGCSTNKHLCDKKCCEECSPCEVLVKKKRSHCSHTVETQCNKSPDETPCKKGCQKMLPCGHFCKNLCYEDCGNCQVKVAKKLPVCGHDIIVPCSKDPDRKNCEGRCPLELACGHICKKACKEPCTSQCKELVDHSKPVACGHKFKIKCYKSRKELDPSSFELLSDCKHPCGTELSCKHMCSGTCGSCAQGRVHKTCQEKCDVTLICGHPCRTPCREACQPCNQPCSFACPHSKCKKKCGQPCTSCKEQCIRRCEHVKCTQKCGQICTVPPCSQPCPKTLPKCGHPCVGFCGDPCPKLCRICDKEELTEIFLGYEDEEDARFVQLHECGHIIESRGMDMCFETLLGAGVTDKKSSVVQYRTCPRCKTTLTWTHRYSDYIKRIIADVVQINSKFLGKQAEIESAQQELRDEIERLSSEKILHSGGLLNDLPYKFIFKIQSKIKVVHQNRRQAFDLTLAKTLVAKLQLFENFLDMCYKLEIVRELKLRNRIGEYAVFLILYLMSDIARITNQEISDFKRELKRFDRLYDFCMIKSEIKNNSTDVHDMERKLEEQLFKPVAFVESLNDEIKKSLVTLKANARVTLQLTEQERRDIVSAMGVAQGAWYKCPNGHYYCIGDCGGAMEERKCLECDARVGGRNHTHRADNSHAGEMDGSRYSAWPTGVDLRNYEM